MLSDPTPGQHAMWERIAASFDRSRTRTWPHVEAFLAALPRGARVLDLMAGNGRHTGTALAHGLDAVWLDWSRPAARIAAQRHPDATVVAADATHLPFADASMDAAICVAGLPSVASADARAACLRELHRVLRPRGLAQLTVWSRDAPRFAGVGTAGDEVDITLPWRGDGHDEQRSYHLYTPGALRKAATDAAFAVVTESQVSIVSAGKPDNLVAVVQR